jgi:hypothetical protein
MKNLAGFVRLVGRYATEHEDVFRCRLLRWNCLGRRWNFVARKRPPVLAAIVVRSENAPAFSTVHGDRKQPPTQIMADKKTNPDQIGVCDGQVKNEV